ncbi:putative peptidyl-prolyl isomerase [Monocercomonoides exilis]|uniref:putative peptidyl-prolyl isomerase n=1 Tax=Monocercomonoides exilis TaxID=2049356 RepID=UPI003559C52E|nr:putative peptidyl-prolyl isomerase [Monocercomonoides exilis]|eukprot:MONOS_3896.1-p1 / transcript=MONOS_3896.1 / gene=MONOS_3896 / organism=Monocercomonoides_exilis_PA203 / gene_product=peptidyl-prolyl isomerase / transcript_product=peptidyl-prolyl isomerase / location=Mono_scaffold00096:75683-76558(-) / protein_length=292 / sequence_SO=supercontig / SO=protein_coding / is_pseudo=false
MSQVVESQKEIDLVPEDPHKVVKTLIKPGKGEQPGKGYVVKMHYFGYLPNGTQFDTSRRNEEPIEFKIGRGQVMKGWEIAVSSMHEGEISDFVISPEYGYGSRGCPPLIPPDTTLKYNIELISCFEDPETTEEKFLFIEKKKNKGNSFFKDSEWKKAMDEYETAIHILKLTYCSGNEEKRKYGEYMVSLLLNCALMLLKMNNYKECISKCTEVLTFDKNNTKAFFRRGAAYNCLGEYEKAKKDLLRASELNPSDNSIQIELDKIKKIEIEKYRKEKLIYSHLFDSTQDSKQ